MVEKKRRFLINKSRFNNAGPILDGQTYKEWLILENGAQVVF
jgi:hypothetical protein